MDLSLLFGLLGIIATVFFGIWGIIVIFKSRYPGRITFVREECISLFRDIVKNMPDLSISHKNQPVKENLILLKGYFLNSGTKDITDLMIKEDLAACLPKDFRWVEVRIVDTSENVEARPKIDNDNRLSFKLGLFRRNEFIKFEALAEVPVKGGKLSPSERLSKEIQFTHRIADTRVVETKSLDDEVELRSALRGISLPILMLIFISLTFFISIWKGTSAKINFLLTDSKGQLIEVKVRQNLSGKIIVNQVDGDFKDVYSAEAFFSKGPYKVKLAETKYDRVLKILAVLLIYFTFLGSGIFIYIDHRRMNRLRKLLRYPIQK